MAEGRDLRERIPAEQPDSQDLGEQGIQHLGLPVNLVADAKLVLTDDLIREALARAKKRHEGRPGDGAEMDEDDLNEDVED